jgi:hypothetical protein
MIEFRDRVIAQGRKKHATRTGIVVVLAKHLKAALEAAEPIDARAGYSEGVSRRRRLVRNRRARHGRDAK